MLNGDCINLFSTNESEHIFNMYKIYEKRKRAIRAANKLIKRIEGVYLPIQKEN